MTLAFFPLLLLEVLSFKVLEVVIERNVYTMTTGNKKNKQQMENSTLNSA
jgi:hypothetical protein